MWHAGKSEGVWQRVVDSATEVCASRPDLIMWCKKSDACQYHEEKQ